MNQPYGTLTLASALREMFGVQLYQNNARALLSRILSILNLDWIWKWTHTYINFQRKTDHSCTDWPDLGPGGTQIWVEQGCAAQASKPIPIFKGDFGQKGYPFLRIFREK